MSSFLTPFLRLARTCTPWVLAVVMCLSAFGMHEHLHTDPTPVTACADHLDESGCDLAECACPTPAAVLSDAALPTLVTLGANLRHVLTEVDPPSAQDIGPEPPPAQRT